MNDIEQPDGFFVIDLYGKTLNILQTSHDMRTNESKWTIAPNLKLLD